MYRYLSKKKFSSGKLNNPFRTHSHKILKVGDKEFNYYNLNTLGSNVGKIFNDI
jgi:hypothetical protein